MSIKNINNKETMSIKTISIKNKDNKETMLIKTMTIMKQYQ